MFNCRPGIISDIPRYVTLRERVSADARVAFRSVVFLCLALLSGCSFLRSDPPSLYVVNRGDTLSSLSVRYGIPVSRIVDANDLDDPDRLEVGQILRFPEGRANTVSRAVAAARPNPLPPPSEKEVRRIRLTTGSQYVGKLLWPVEGGEMGSDFGWRALSFHEGIDIRAEEGTPIRAAHDGVVAYSGRGLSGYGNLIVLRGDGIVTVYGHNRTNDVEPGDIVQRGDEIGEVGMTGRASGPHLHFEVRVRTETGAKAAVNPMVFLAPRPFDAADAHLSVTARNEPPVYRGLQVAPPVSPDLGVN